MRLQAKFFLLLPLLAGTLFMTSCNNDDDTVVPDKPEVKEPATETASKTYALGAVSDPDISGTAKFVTFSNDSTVIELKLEGTTAGNTHPAHIHINTAAESGAIVLDLIPVDGATGESSTTVTTLNDGTPISYDELLEFDGYINVHFSADDLGTLVAQGDIGQNELTGESVEYALASVSDAAISGTATFSQRVNEETLVSIDLEGTTAGNMHPAHIHMGSVADAPGDIIVSLAPVSGDTGTSRTNVTALDGENNVANGGAALKYSDLINIDGYINVHVSAENLATLIAQSNVGANEGEEEEAEAVNYDVTNQGASAYIFNSDSLTNIKNPDLNLKRGQTYTFTVKATGHPFYIKSQNSTGTANAFDNGVENNGTQDGVVTFTVPMDAPDTLWYNCEFHTSMTGVLNIED